MQQPKHSVPKILSIVWYKVLPARYGGQKGIALFNQHLSGHYPLVCLCSSNNEPADFLSYQLKPVLPTGKWQFINPAIWWTILSEAKKNKVSHVIIEHPYHAIAGYLCKLFMRTKLVIHSHNIEHTRFKEQQKWWWYLLRYFEHWAHTKADLSLFKTPNDLNDAVNNFKLDESKCMVVPYGVEKATPKILKEKEKKILASKHAEIRNKKIALYAGTLDYLPNAKEVENIYKNVAPPLPANEYVIVICGRNKLPEFQYLKGLTHEAIVYAGEVEDLEMYYAAADVFINPLAASSGVQTKTMDALQHGLNVVCFAGNIEGVPMELVQAKMFIAADNDWGDFVLKMIEACKISSPTPALFFETYSWEEIVTRLANKIN